MSARIFVHPRCMNGPAFGSLVAALDAVGMDTSNVNIGPENKRGHRELVRLVAAHDNGGMYERMDGTRFLHRTGSLAPEPTAA